MKEARIIIQIKNNILLKMIEENYKSIKDFSEKNNISYPSICALAALTRSPITSKGEYTVTAKKIANILKVIPEFLFPLNLYKIENPKQQKEVDLKNIMIEKEKSRMLESPEDIVLRNERIATIRNMLNTIPDREAEVIRMRYGIECREHTIEECSKYFGVTRERIRQIESNGLRRLRHPRRHKGIENILRG